MFDNLQDRLQSTVKKLKGQARLTDANIKDTLKDIRVSLLEADVALPVVKGFIADIRKRAIGREVQKSLNPGQALVKVVQQELISVMGQENEKLNLQAQRPVVVLMAGLQGSGKTTSTAKLAKRLKEKDKQQVLVVSCDVYRPAAMEQLKILANELEVEAYPAQPTQKPRDIAVAAHEYAKKEKKFFFIYYPPGRLSVDQEMMQEIKDIHQATSPTETLFVVDSMTGQDAANTAKAFGEVLPLTGVILTKTDGDARGGAALSVRTVTGAPIKFIGSGEKVADLEAFHPDRIASRILGMGDVLSLVEELEQKVDQQQAAKMAKKIHQGRGFTLVDFKEQMQQMMNMGGIGAMLDKLPGAGAMSEAVASQASDKEAKRMIAIIDSMTLQERQMPDLIQGSRKRRIAAGSGSDIQHVNKLLKNFKQSQKMMKKMKGGGMKKMMRAMSGLGGMGGGMPPMR
jgi:signal recognition particle subunit SRP54